MPGLMGWMQGLWSAGGRSAGRVTGAGRFGRVYGTSVMYGAGVGAVGGFAMSDEDRFGGAIRGAALGAGLGIGFTSLRRMDRYGSIMARRRALYPRAGGNVVMGTDPVTVAQSVASGAGASITSPVGQAASQMSASVASNKMNLNQLSLFPRTPMDIARETLTSNVTRGGMMYETASPVNLLKYGERARQATAGFAATFGLFPGRVVGGTQLSLGGMSAKELRRESLLQQRRLSREERAFQQGPWASIYRGKKGQTIPFGGEIPMPGYIPPIPTRNRPATAKGSIFDVMKPAGRATGSRYGYF